jgi:hypothetical protein
VLPLRWLRPGNIEGLALLVLLAFALAAYLPAIAFFMPRHYDASVDAIHPAISLEAIDSTFSERHPAGLKYPRLHLLVVGAVQRAVLAAQHGWREGSAIAAAIVATLREGAGATPLERRDAFEPHREAIGAAIVAGRVVSALFALLLVFAVHLLGKELLSGVAGFVAAFATAVSYPVVYYAHTLNVDAPYLGVAALALAFAARAARRGGTCDLLIAALLAAAAIAIKDQAYAWFVFAVPLVLLGVAPGGGVRPRAKAVAISLLAALGWLALAQGLPFDLAGVRSHFEHIVGSGSTSYRVYEPGIAGQFALAHEVALHVTDACGFGLIAFALVGVYAMARRSRPALLWIGLPALSAHVCFQAVIGYTYLRFNLPIVIAVHLAAGAGAAALLGHRRLRLPALLLLLITLGERTQRAIEVSRLLAEDTRAPASEFLAAAAIPGETIVAALELPTHSLEFPPGSRVLLVDAGKGPPPRPAAGPPRRLVQAIFDPLRTAHRPDPEPPSIPESLTVYGVRYVRVALFQPALDHPLRRGATVTPTIGIFEVENP